MKARRITDAELVATVGPIFRSVFASDDAFGRPFTDRLLHRAILYPVGFELMDDEFGALSQAAEVVGDSRFYVACLEEVGEPHYVVPFDYDEYLSVPKGAGENAIYSPSGSWGLIFSHEVHCVVGAMQLFLERLRQEFPAVEPLHAPDEEWEPIPFDPQVHEFLRYLKGRADEGFGPYPWLRELLEHVYGEEAANSLIAEHGFQSRA